MALSEQLLLAVSVGEPCCCVCSASDAGMVVEQSLGDQEPFIPPPCMASALLTNGHASMDVAARDDADVVDEEIVVATAEVHADKDELTAEKAAEKMIERRIQV